MTTWLEDGVEVWSRDGAHVGFIRGRRPCQLEGCRGLAVRVAWADGRVTWPCSKGLVEHAGEGAGLQIG